jgi:low temperature requirement protein LtrA
MSGRDPHESHRAATPLELLFDLTFVIAFGVAASPAAVVASFESHGHRRTVRALAKNTGSA